MRSEKNGHRNRNRETMKNKLVHKTEHKPDNSIINIKNINKVY